ncbi:MAG: hypothetical protein R2874_06545 [Desulfobacterales bacterium]
MEINGVTAVKDGDIYKIVPLKDVSPPAHHEPEHHPKQSPAGRAGDYSGDSLASLAAPGNTSF